MADTAGESPPPVPNTESLVRIYIKMRDARAKVKADFELRDAAIRAQMDTIEAHLLDTCKAAGANSIKTDSGTIMRGVKTHFWTSDWESMHAFIKENNALDLLERRVAQKAMGDFLSKNPDKLPKGMNVDSKFSITVRRST